MLFDRWYRSLIARWPLRTNKQPSICNAWRRQGAFLQHVIDGIEDPILVIDLEQQVQTMNRAARELVAKPKTPKTLACYQLLYGYDQPCDANHMPCPYQQVLTTEQSCKVLHKLTAPDGSEHTYEIAASPLRNDANQIIGVIETRRDITTHLSLAEELRASELNILRLSQYDLLTSLPNRLLFADRISQAIECAREQEAMVAVLIVDIDDFKYINDSFDHNDGDQIIKDAAKRLQDYLEAQETVARLGGDEFGIISAPFHEIEQAALIARRILHRFETPFELHEHRIVLGASVGISLYPMHGTGTDDLLRNADAALYQAKNQGGKNYQYYTEDLTTKSIDRVLLESNLHRALEQGEFVLHYQPQLDLLSNALSGLEALVRWQHPQMGMISPLRFIPLAEESGMITELGAWVLREACRQMQTWRSNEQFPPTATMSVNVSARQFDRTNLTDTVQQILTDTGLPAELLELEITESTVMRSPEGSVQILHQLRELGIRISIDDFGTGYSSLSHLKRLPLTKLKIDRSFVSDIPADVNDVAITRAIIALARNLSLEVLAEGVETLEQKNFLLREGCHTVQGFLFAKPMPAAECEQYIRGLNSPAA